MHSDDYETVRLLIESGGDLDSWNTAGRTPLHQYFNKVTRQILLVHDGPIDLYAQDHEGMTILHYLSFSKTTHPLELQRLVGNDLTSLSIKDHLGRSALSFAAMRGNVPLLEWIHGLGNHFSPSAVDPDSIPLLHYAAYSKRTETLNYMGRYCKDFTIKDHRGRSILHHAVLGNNLAAVQKVVQLCGAHLLHQEDFEGETPLQLAARIGAWSTTNYGDTLVGAAPLAETARQSPVRSVLQGKTKKTISSYLTRVLRRLQILAKIDLFTLVLTLFVVSICTCIRT